MVEDLAQADAEWPAFDLPASVTPGDTPAGDSPPAPVPANPAIPAAAQPPAGAAAPPAQPKIPPTGGAAEPSPGASEVVPKYRLDDQREKFEGIIAAQTQQIADLTALVGKAMGGAAPRGAAAPEPEPPNPQDVKIRERLLAVFPELKLLDELKELAARKTELLGTTDAVGRYQSAETQYYDRYAERTLGTIFDKMAALQLGEGKTGADLNELAKSGVLSTFTKWVTADPARAARYEAEDAKLLDEFWGAYKAAMFDPVRRDANAELLSRAQHPPALPAGGGSGPAPPIAPVKTTGLDEDEVHARAWATRDSVGV